MSKSDQQQIVIPRLRESRVPWLELETAIKCSNALGSLLGTHIVHSLEDGNLTNVDTLVGIEALTYDVGRRLQNAFDDAHAAHEAERKLA